MDFKTLNEHLFKFITEERKALMYNQLKERTNHLTLVLEDIYTPQNASAAVRTCDCMGVQNIHVIENINHFETNDLVLKGSANWVNINQYNQYKGQSNSPEAIEHLKSKGYKIIGTMPDVKATKLNEFKVTNERLAIVMGTEKTGISEYVKEQADDFIYIPMYGYTESYNISVSAALILYDLVHKLRASNIEWQLNKDEEFEVINYWLRTSIKGSSQIIERILKEEA